MKGDKLRLKKIIESDRMNFAVSGQELIKKDVTSVLSDYFTLTEPIALNISGKKRRIRYRDYRESRRHKGVQSFAVIYRAVSSIP